jgi:hypothetical protein
VSRCDQCRHWKESAEGWEARVAGFRLCEGVRERWRITDNVKSSYERPDDEPYESWEADIGNALKAARAYVEDGSEYKAYLWTAPDFFCALFEPPPSKPWPGPSQ